MNKPMSKGMKEYMELILKDKKLKLQHLHEEHRIAIAVYNAKREMLMKDIDVLEHELNN